MHDREIYLVSFYDFSVVFRKYSDSVVCVVCHFLGIFM